MQHTAPETLTASRRRRLGIVLLLGGMDIVPVVDEVGLAYDPSSGPLDPADLFQFVTPTRKASWF